MEERLFPLLVTAPSEEALDDSVPTWNQMVRGKVAGGIADAVMRRVSAV